MRTLLVLAAGCLRAPHPASGDGGSGSGIDGAPPDQTPNIAFVTSATIQFGSITGLAAADAMCNSAAAAAGRSGTFVAWLSDAQIDARSRLANARGWVRTDGLPFADTISDLTTGKILYPPRYDELENEHAEASDFVATATAPTGTSAIDNCNDFTSVNANMAVGVATSAGSEWTDFESLTCNASGRLYCFQIDHQAALPAPMLPTTHRIAFVSNGTFMTGPTGLVDADALCTSEAQGAALPGTFVAALSTAMPAASRFQLGVPWYRPDGVEVSADFAHLLAPIDTLASGAYVSTAMLVSTGSMDPTVASGNSCSNWTSSSATATGIAGDPYDSSSNWWYATGFVACDLPRHVYCFQQ